MKVTFLASLLVLFAATTVSATERTWTDSSNRFTVTAELVSLTNGTVTLKRTDGKIIALPVSRLSKADREFLRSTTDVVSKKKKVKKQPTKKRQPSGAPNRTAKEEKISPDSDHARIQGVWMITATWLDGKEHTDKFSNAMRFSKDTFQAGAYVKGEFHVGEFARKFKLDETKTPKRFDKYGVYSLDGDNLILCFSNAGLKIPKSIPKEGKKGDNLQIYVLTRVKDKQPHQQNANESINPPNVKGTLNK